MWLCTEKYYFICPKQKKLGRRFPHTSLPNAISGYQPQKMLLPMTCIPKKKNNIVLKKGLPTYKPPKCHHWVWYYYTLCGIPQRLFPMMYVEKTEHGILFHYSCPMKVSQLGPPSLYLGKLQAQAKFNMLDHKHRVAYLDQDAGHNLSAHPFWLKLCNANKQ